MPANVKAWSRFSYGDRDESRTFTCINTSHDHYINPDLEDIYKRIRYNEWLNFQLMDNLLINLDSRVRNLAKLQRKKNLIFKNAQIPQYQIFIFYNNAFMKISSSIFRCVLLNSFREPSRWGLWNCESYFNPFKCLPFIKKLIYIE